MSQVKYDIVFLAVNCDFGNPFLHLHCNIRLKIEVMIKASVNVEFPRGENLLYKYMKRKYYSNNSPV